MADVADRLRVCKKRSDLSLAEIKARTSISRSHISGSHNGIQPISTEFLERLAGPYRTTVAWLRDGNPAVNVWSEFQFTAQARELGGADTGRGARAAAVLHYLAGRYPGHLLPEDIPHHMNVSHGLVEDILNGRRQPTDEFLRTLAQLSGVPYGWLQVGNIEVMNGLGRPDDPPVEELRQWLEIAKQAKTIGVTPADVGAILTIMAKNKGGA